MSYTLTHDDAPGREIEVEQDQVPGYLAQGWKTKPNVADPEPVDSGPEVTVLADQLPTKKTTRKKA